METFAAEYFLCDGVGFFGYGNDLVLVGLFGHSHFLTFLQIFVCLIYQRRLIYFYSMFIYWV